MKIVQDTKRLNGKPHTGKMSLAELHRVRPVVFTAQSKKQFYCRDAICEFAFSKGVVPLNPFRAFEYFLSDRVDRDVVREGNTNLIRICDELWVFGTSIADGVLAEIEYANELGLPIKLFTVSNMAGKIRSARADQLRPEPELVRSGISAKHIVSALNGLRMVDSAQVSLFDCE